MPVLDCGGLFKDYELHKVQALSADIAHGCSFAELLGVEIKFVLTLWKLMIKETAKVLC